MKANEPDQFFLHRALELAEKSFGLASPNPNVGALLVDADGVVVGEGFHTYDGLKHAEILAIEQAGEKARGATLYINLEPCSHHGRTGPCTEALIAAGIRRVVACTADPNPTVSGRGFARLRQAGVQPIGAIMTKLSARDSAYGYYQSYYYYRTTNESPQLEKA